MFPQSYPKPTEESRPGPPVSLGAPLIAVLAVGMVLGFVMGWVSFESPWSGASSPSVLYDEELVTSIYERVVPAVVELGITPRTRRARQERGQGSVVGSGFLVDDQGHIVTNYHVVDGAGEIEVRMFGGLVVSATLLGYSRADDLALLQVDPAEVAGIKPLSLADSSEISPGEMAIAIGSPFGYPSSISVGVVSGTSVSRPSVLRRPIPDMVQTDAALNPGNSGGPLLNSKGEVIGISTSVQVFASVDTGVGFAVSSNTLRGVLQELTQPGELKRPWIGISGEPITRSLSILLGLPSETGIYVSVVLDDGPAARADIRGDSGGTSGQGDIIIAVDGEKVASVADLVDYLNTLRPGDEVTLTIIREGETKDVGVTLAEWDS